MCGIVGYTGRRDAAPRLVEGLKRLEYRGYDSAGVALANGGGVVVRKLAARVAALAEQLGREPVHGTTGIAHTRWATHGAPTQRNAHPHVDCHGEIALVHNGIIENADVLRAALERAGHRFSSETDTETLAHLIEDAAGSTLEERVIAALAHVDGTYGLAVMSGAEPGKIVVARQGSPVLLGIGEDELFVASDASAVLEHTRAVVYLDDGDIAVLTPEGYHVIDRESHVQLREVDAIAWDLGAIELGGYPHFMLKEIMEQREALGRALNQPAELVQTVARAMRVAENLFFAGCGTAGKVAQMGTYLFADVAGRPSSFILGSEFKNYRHSLHERTLLVAISQSGETADLLEAVEVAGARGSTVIAVVNVPGSTLTRLADHTLLVNAGPEKAVCSTKATLGQIAIITLLAYACAGLPADGFELVTHASATIERTLTPKSLERIHDLARRFKDAHDMYIIGRGLSYPVALEAAVKIQEVSYIHAEGLAGGELKHYAIALIEPGTPCIALVPDDETRHEILSNATEVKARGGTIIGIAPEAHPIFDVHLPVSDAGMASAIVNLVPVQILAYYLAVERGFDPDMPRNLAKSVTVK